MHIHRRLNSYGVGIVLFLAASSQLACISGDRSDHVPQGAVHEHTGGSQEEETPRAAVSTPTIVDGVQIVEVSVTPTGYSANSVAVEAGVPVRLVFTRVEDGGCAEQVQIPELGIEPTPLPLGEPVAIEFTPQHDGEYTFACGMDMLRGKLVVGS